MDYCEKKYYKKFGYEPEKELEIEEDDKIQVEGFVTDMDIE